MQHLQVQFCIVPCCLLFFIPLFIVSQNLSGLDTNHTETLNHTICKRRSASRGLRHRTTTLKPVIPAPELDLSTEPPYLVSVPPDITSTASNLDLALPTDIVSSVVVTPTTEGSGSFDILQASTATTNQDTGDGYMHRL